MAFTLVIDVYVNNVNCHTNEVGSKSFVKFRHYAAVNFADHCARERRLLDLNYGAVVDMKLVESPCIRQVV